MVKKITYILLVLIIDAQSSIAQNMIINGGFETSSKASNSGNPNEFMDSCDGYVNGWISSFGSPDIYYGIPNSGQLGASVGYFLSTSQIFTCEGFFQKDVIIKAGIKYTLKFYLKADDEAILIVKLHKTNLIKKGDCLPGNGAFRSPPCINIPQQQCPDIQRQTTLGELELFKRNINISYSTYTLIELSFTPTSDYLCIEFSSTENSGHENKLSYIDDICLTSPCCQVSKEWQNVTDDPTSLSNIQQTSLNDTRVTSYILAGVDNINNWQGNVVHNHNTKLIFQAGNKINLKRGFIVKEGSPFNANLKGCNNDFWVNLQYIINNCDITLWCNPCGGCGPYTYIWKDNSGNVLATPSPYTFLQVGIITENKTYSITVTDVSSGQTYTEAINLGPCGCIKPAGPPATTITICSNQDACQEIGIARVPKMTYSWIASDQAAQGFISSSNTSYTKICIPESYRHLGTLKVYLSITNECNDVVITQHDFACCPLPQVSAVHIDICNKNYYELGPQNWSNFYGYTFQWTASNQADLSLLSGQTISNPTITLAANSTLPNFPLHYTLIGTNSCGNSFSQDYILEGTPQAPMMNSPISNGWCNYPNMPNIPCNPQYSNNTHELYLKVYINSSSIHITEITIDIYDNNNNLVKSKTFNDANGYNNLVNIDFLIPNINLNCLTNSYRYEIYYRRDCDIFPLFGFASTAGIQCY